MRFSSLASTLAFVCLPGAALAGQAAPYVIPGIGPEQYAAAPTQPQQEASDPYGGGLVELLVTGREPGANGAIYNHPQEAAPAAVPIQKLAYAPEALAPSAVKIDPIFQRQEVEYGGPEEPGTIVVDPRRKFLFLVQPGGRALRYGIGVGRPGFEWAGVKTVTRKAEWPSWTPPAQMRLRQPSLPVRMAGGPDNPLGARALYLGSSLYRIHGTNQPDTIGKDMSSGCIRMMNADVENLYERVKVGTKVVVL